MAQVHRGAVNLDHAHRLAAAVAEFSIGDRARSAAVVEHPTPVVGLGRVGLVGVGVPIGVAARVVVLIGGENDRDGFSAQDVAGAVHTEVVPVTVALDNDPRLDGQGEIGRHADVATQDIRDTGILPGAVDAVGRAIEHNAFPGGGRQVAIEARETGAVKRDGVIAVADKGAGGHRGRGFFALDAVVRVVREDPILDRNGLGDAVDVPHADAVLAAVSEGAVTQVHRGTVDLDHTLDLSATIAELRMSDRARSTPVVEHPTPVVGLGWVRLVGVGVLVGVAARVVVLIGSEDHPGVFGAQDVTGAVHTQAVPEAIGLDDDPSFDGQGEIARHGDVATQNIRNTGVFPGAAVLICRTCKVDGILRSGRQVAVEVGETGAFQIEGSAVVGEGTTPHLGRGILSVDSIVAVVLEDPVLDGNGLSVAIDIPHADAVLAAVAEGAVAQVHRGAVNLDHARGLATAVAEFSVGDRAGSAAVVDHPTPVVASWLAIISVAVGVAAHVVLIGGEDHRVGFGA